MNYPKLLLIIFCAVMLSTCKKTTTNPSADLQVPIMNGFLLTDNNGDPIGTYGSATPDIKTSDNGGGFLSGNYYMGAYPNPNNYYYNSIHGPITVFWGSRQPINTVNVWLERGEFDAAPDQTVNAAGAAYFEANAYIIQQSFTKPAFHEIALNTDSLAPGYYRVYVDINGTLLWDNLVINLNIF